MRRSAFLLCGDWHLAEDLTQMTLVKMYRAWPKVNRTDRPITVLVLRYYEAFSVAETADMLGCSEGTVKSQAARGLATMKIALGDDSVASLLTGVEEEYR